MRISPLFLLIALVLLSACGGGENAVNATHPDETLPVESDTTDPGSPAAAGTTSDATTNPGGVPTTTDGAIRDDSGFAATKTTT